jgi:filamentous hemagglutinin
VQQQNTIVVAGGNLSLQSGKNTTLSGAEVDGNSIAAQIGGNLNITSLQDTDSYLASSSSLGASLGVTGNIVSGSFNASQGKANSSFASVLNQSGIYAGAGGFNIAAGGNTNLTGGVISSTAPASQNSLTTGTLSYSNVQNAANYSASQTSFGFGATSTGGTGGVTSGFGQTSLSGSAQGTTYAAISPGSVTVTNGTAPPGLSRDASAANAGSLAPIFDPAQVQLQLQTTQLAAQVAMTGAGDIADALESQQTLKKLQTNPGTTDLSTPWDEGGVDRDLLHGLAAGLAAGLMGGNGLGAATGAIAGEIADDAVHDALKKSLGPTGPSLLSTLLSNVAAGLPVLRLAEVRARRSRWREISSTARSIKAKPSASSK